MLHRFRLPIPSRNHQKLSSNFFTPSSSNFSSQLFQTQSSQFKSTSLAASNSSELSRGISFNSKNGPGNRNSTGSEEMQDDGVADEGKDTVGGNGSNGTNGSSAAKEEMTPSPSTTSPKLASLPLERPPRISPDSHQSFPFGIIPVPSLPHFSARQASVDSFFAAGRPMLEFELPPSNRRTLRSLDPNSMGDGAWEDIVSSMDRAVHSFTLEPSPTREEDVDLQNSNEGASIVFAIPIPRSYRPQELLAQHAYDSEAETEALENDEAMFYRGKSVGMAKREFLNSFLVTEPLVESEEWANQPKGRGREIKRYLAGCMGRQPPYPSPVTLPLPTPTSLLLSSLPPTARAAHSYIAPFSQMGQAPKPPKLPSLEIGNDNEGLVEWSRLKLSEAEVKYRWGEAETWEKFFGNEDILKKAVEDLAEKSREWQYKGRRKRTGDRIKVAAQNLTKEELETMVDQGQNFEPENEKQVNLSEIKNDTTQLSSVDQIVTSLLSKKNTTVSFPISNLLPVIQALRDSGAIHEGFSFKVDSGEEVEDSKEEKKKVVAVKRSRLGRVRTFGGRSSRIVTVNLSRRGNEGASLDSVKRKRKKKMNKQKYKKRRCE